MENLTILLAQTSNIIEIVALLQDDELGKTRETANVEQYTQALKAIIAAENNEFYLAFIDHEIVGCFQLTIIPSLSRGASTRAQIESVRVKSDFRGQGIGREMMNWAIAYSAYIGCNLVQLTTDKTRDKAYDFYMELGFEPSHIGMKLHI
ncbi:MAG: GNAT family N-acetyltransferase [Hyphomicrobiales bacterium]|nr:MAG: GNAT family N-acetyltransferase [Hyphomicrobiales bacterium]